MSELRTPYFEISKKKALAQYNKLLEFADLISYSSKTNQDITGILEEETNCFFSMHFKNELKHLKNKSRALFIAQGWNKDFIQELLNQGITHFIVDNESDLDIFIDFLKNNDVKEKLTLFLRMNLKENTIRTEKYYVFGMKSEVINSRLKELDELRKGKLKDKLEKLGIHFHRKTQNLSEWNLVYELSQIIDEENWQIIDFVNIGGGLPSTYANTNEKVFDSIYKKICDLKEFLNKQDIKLIAEPGRFIAAPAGRLVSSIIGIHDDTIIVDASVYNGDLDAIVVPVKLLIKDELRKETSLVEDFKGAKPYKVKGVTPCSMDIFRYKAFFKDPKVGDKLVFLNAGAYNFASDFCDLEKMPSKIVEDFS